MRNKLSGFFAAAAMAAAMASTASATIVFCDSGAVSNVVGATCTEGPLTFTSFNDSFSGGFSDVPPYESAIGIGNSSAGTGVFGNDVDLGFQISVEGAGSPDNGDIALSYVVLGGIIGVDMAVQASPVISGGSLTVTEIACDQAFAGTVCPGSPSNTLANFSVTSFGGPATAQQLFTRAYSGPVYLLKDLGYEGATTSSLVNSQVIGAPEPMTLSLVGAGLLGLGLAGRRRLRK